MNLRKIEKASFDKISYPGTLCY